MGLQVVAGLFFFVAGFFLATYSDPRVSVVRNSIVVVRHLIQSPVLLFGANSFSCGLAGLVKLLRIRDKTRVMLTQRTPIMSATIGLPPAEVE